MKTIELGLRSKQNVIGVAVDPQPDWIFDSLLLELNSIDRKLNSGREHLTKLQMRELRDSKKDDSSARSSLMYVSDDENSSNSDWDTEEEAMPVARCRRFSCEELYVSDDSEDETPIEMPHLMNRAGLAERAPIELTQELQLSLNEDVRSKISSMEAEQVNEYEKFMFLINKVDRHREFQLEKERIFDLHHQRIIAEALDNHLTSIQRDLAHISQLEERRIRNDDAREEAKRKEKALLEEKLRQERIQAEEEARLKGEQSEKAKPAAIEAAETWRNSAHNAAKDPNGIPGNFMVSGVDVEKDSPPAARTVIRAAENALELEKRRSQIYEELSTQNTTLKISVNEEYSKYGRKMARIIRTLSAKAENIRKNVEEIIKLISSEGYLQSIGIQLFAEKIVSQYKKLDHFDVIFATARVIVLVTSNIPVAMDILLAELNRVCIYTVPKHIIFSEEVYKTNDSYNEAIGYFKTNGTMESLDEFLERLRVHMKLYGALVQICFSSITTPRFLEIRPFLIVILWQTEVPGSQNLHGLQEGWAWLARFLNSLPANLYTAVALYSFLQMAGYTLYRRYKKQFEKLLNIIARDFINSLQVGGYKSWNTHLSEVKTSLRGYIELCQYLNEPTGLPIRSHFHSNEVSW